jgi:S1-C subfamily serine protease
MRELRLDGVAVLRVLPGSGAEAAGLRGVVVEPGNRVAPGDVILALDGVKVTSVGELLALVDDRRVGDAVRLTIWRNGGQVQLTVGLGASNDAAVL